MENARAAAAADIVVLTVPFAHHADIVGIIRDAVRGKVLVDTTVPLMPPRVGTVQLPAGGCAALETQRLVDPSTNVVSAFQNVAADKMRSLEPIDCDVLVAGDSKEAREVTAELVRAAGLRPFHAGPLANSAAAEALTSVLITLNRQFKCQTGIRITGLP
jgi:NADPH-dependent F420 reductase